MFVLGEDGIGEKMPRNHLAERGAMRLCAEAWWITANIVKLPELLKTLLGPQQ